MPTIDPLPCSRCGNYIGVGKYRCTCYTTQIPMPPLIEGNSSGKWWSQEELDKAYNQGYLIGYNTKACETNKALTSAFKGGFEEGYELGYSTGYSDGKDQAASPRQDSEGKR